MADTLLLDEQSINTDDLSKATLVHELNLQKKPNWLLVKFMNALEGKRQKKKLGWSRPWNKYDLNVFRTHTSNLDIDKEFTGKIFNSLLNTIDELPENYRAFIESLKDDPNLMAFTFYHNRDVKNSQYEGLTLSFGRRLLDDRTKRERLDIVLEDKRLDGSVDGTIDHIRVYVNPWNEFSRDEYYLYQRKDSEISPVFQELYKDSISLYDQWKNDESRQWQHWSVKFIDYFGPRSFIPVNSSFK